MKITIPRQDLLDAVNKVKTVVASKSALPILSHILFEASDNQVVLSATDLKVSVQCKVDCSVVQSGCMTVACQRLASILTELPDGDVTLELTESNVVSLECGKIHTRLFSMSPEEFPPIRDFDGVEPLVLPQVALKKLFTKTSFAICTDHARYNLTGLLCEIMGGKLAVVATDGRRMSLCIEREGIPEGIEVKVIVPGKMVSELERLLGDEGDVSILIDEAQAAFAFGSLKLVTALIEGSFPNYEMVVPKKHDKEMLVETARLSEAIRRTRTMTNEKFNSVRFVLSDGTLALKVVTPEVGEYEEELPVEYEGEGVEIAFNPDFVLDVLRRIEGDKVCLTLKDAGNPGVVKPFSETGDDTYLNIIMPIRI
ncbi:MAG TPA: DNA polymerase III subunit beta [Candidatus Hydrogenedentes bacterium]|nr:DNA polymerase III subunit beta [Candidatus Hydrogenedentota bacterium]HPG65576.1 DNA polymerase III subunit beta [Candidatus Hydrogenedentota bacterium]